MRDMGEAGGRRESLGSNKEKLEICKAGIPRACVPEGGKRGLPRLLHLQHVCTAFCRSQPVERCLRLHCRLMSWR